MKLNVVFYWPEILQFNNYPFHLIHDQNYQATSLISKIAIMRSASIKKGIIENTQFKM